MRTGGVWLTAASIAALVACGRDSPASARRPGTARAAIAQVQLRHTSAAALRTALGDPDEEAADGTLVYRFAGSSRVEAETVRFQFADGMLSRICRDRSS
jgi:hypothetical protein